MWKAPSKPPHKTLAKSPYNPKWYRQWIPQDEAPRNVASPNKQEPIGHVHENSRLFFSVHSKAAFKRIADVYDYILSQAAEKLGALNNGIRDYNIDGGASYAIAAQDFNDFLGEVNDLDSNTNSNARTMQWAVIEPVMQGDYIVGAVVKVKWLGGTHSSSSGVAIPH